MSIPVGECFTYRWAAVDSDGQDITVPWHDFAAVRIHIEGSGILGYCSGTVQGSTNALFTSDGTNVPLDDLDLSAMSGGTTIMNIAASGEATINISLFAWR